MKVICRSCAKLIPEEEAIKMTEASYKTFEMIKLGIQFIQMTEFDYNRYTQICEDCYNLVYRRKK